MIGVSTPAQLQNAVASIASNTTIMIAPGTYSISSTLYINGSFTNVAIRGATGNHDDVVIVGKGMNAASDGGVPFGIWVGGNVRGVTIADLTIRDVYYHPIILNAGDHSPLIHNVRLVNAGQQFMKSNPDAQVSASTTASSNTLSSSTTPPVATTTRTAWTSTAGPTGSSATTCSATSARRRGCWPAPPS